MAFWTGWIRARRERRALEALTEAAAASPDDDRLILKLADRYLRLGDQERARSAYDHAAQILTRRRDTHKAAAVLKRLVAIHPRCIDVRLRLAEAYANLQRLRETAHELEQAGWLAKNAGRQADAEHYFARSLALDPSRLYLQEELPPAPTAEIPKIIPFPNDRVSRPPPDAPTDPASVFGLATIAEVMGDTVEYSPTDLQTLLDDELPDFDEAHRPRSTA